MTATDHVCVGAIAGAFGVKGEVRLKSFCSDPEAIAAYGPLATEDGKRRCKVTLTRVIPNGFSARLSGVATLTRRFVDAIAHAARHLALCRARPPARTG